MSGPVNVLITGRGTAGSWKIRGEQLAEAMGCEAMPMAVDHRLPVVVKRLRPELLDMLRGRFWVWDIVDAWPQPAGNEWDRETAIGWLRGEIARLQPGAVVFATDAMMRDAEFDGPCISLPHHAWAKYQPKPLREAGPLVIGYEGGEQYLGRWLPVIKDECRRHGWRFQIGNLQQCDVGLALRDCSGYAPANWKSNVKLANLQALGIPAICSPEAGYRETACGAEIFVSTEAELRDALGVACSLDYRRMAREASQHPRLDAIARKYAAWLSTLSC